MYKKAIILLSFLAYSLTLIHSLVPHHHNEEANNEHHHHHHGNQKDHHHNEHDNDNESLSHLFADAIHHPASEVVIHNAGSKHIQKSNNPVDLLIASIGEIVFLRIRPPDPSTRYQVKHYSSQQDSFSLLRAPPVA